MNIMDVKIFQKKYKKHLTNNKKYGIINTEIKKRGKQNENQRKRNRVRHGRNNS